MNTIYFLHYNNYYNRKIQAENTFTNYLQYVVGESVQINFVPGNGVTTQHVFNLTELNNVDLAPADYLLVVESPDTIISRWFIVGQRRTLKGQVIMDLRRDVVMDHIQNVLNSDCFIEKGIVSPTDDAIFNSENMTYSQIKTGEYLIKDASKCAWIIGYYARNSGEGINELSGTYDPDNIASINLATPITEWEEYKYTTENFIGAPDRLTYATTMRAGATSVVYQNYRLRVIDRTSSTFIDTELDPISSTGYTDYITPDTDENVIFSKLNTQFQPIKATLFEQAKTVVAFSTSEDEIEFANYDGKIIRDSNGNYYQIQVTQQVQSINRAVTAGSLYNSLNAALIAAGFTRRNTTSEFILTVHATFYKLVLTQLTSNSQISYNITANRYFTDDAPYDIFAIPYGDFTFQDVSSGGGTVVCKKSVAFTTANAIANKYAGGGVLYDLQLLPYCPIENVIDGSLQVNDPRAYSWINQGSQHVGVILNVSNSTFKRTLSIPVINIDNYKLDSETKFVRFCSPNYNGVFQITPAKNDGISSVTVACTYKPYTPYIQVAPKFARLYGQDFGDARGLICGGDFSLPIVTDQWKTYEIQHKNYAAIFDRQIENMEINNNVSREREKWQVAAGAINGATSALTAGALTGNPYVAAGAAVVGGGISLAAGIKDIQLNELLRNEAIDYTRDAFGYQMGNIQALPNTLNKVSAFNANNKIFPFIEYYECPTVERDALIRKIIYNGMSVGRIGKVKDYIRTWSATTSTGIVGTPYIYIKAQLIRLAKQDSDYDFSIAQAISHELNLGVYISYANPGSNQ